MTNKSMHSCNTSQIRIYVLFVCRSLYCLHPVKNVLGSIFSEWKTIDIHVVNLNHLYLRCSIKNHVIFKQLLGREGT